MFNIKNYEVYRGIADNRLSQAYRSVRIGLKRAKATLMVKGLQFSDFESASRAVIKFLHQRFGFSLWMVTRCEGKSWVVLQSEDHGYGVSTGAVFQWADTFCAEMVKGHGPNIAPRSDLVPAYRTAKMRQQIEIKAYIGYPLYDEDGSVFGTLCGIDPLVQPNTLIEEQTLFELLASLLSTLLQHELRAVETARRLERVQTESLTDALTFLYNRRAWVRFMSMEEERCARYGNRATVLVVDLDNMKQENDTQGHAAGDKLLKRTGAILRRVSRQSDVVARLGGDEFGIISVECGLADIEESLLERTRMALAAANIQASLGLAERTPIGGLKGAWEEADRLMYIEKRLHKALYQEHRVKGRHSLSN